MAILKIAAGSLVDDAVFVCLRHQNKLSSSGWNKMRVKFGAQR